LRWGKKFEGDQKSHLHSFKTDYSPRNFNQRMDFSPAEKQRSGAAAIKMRAHFAAHFIRNYGAIGKLLNCRVVFNWLQSPRRAKSYKTGNVEDLYTI